MSQRPEIPRNQKIRQKIRQEQVTSSYNKVIVTLSNTKVAKEKGLHLILPIWILRSSARPDGELKNRQIKAGFVPEPKTNLKIILLSVLTLYKLRN